MILILVLKDVKRFHSLGCNLLSSLGGCRTEPWAPCPGEQAQGARELRWRVCSDRWNNKGWEGVNSLCPLCTLLHLGSPFCLLPLEQQISGELSVSNCHLLLSTSETIPFQLFLPLRITTFLFPKLFLLQLGQLCIRGFEFDCLLNGDMFHCWKVTQIIVGPFFLLSTRF